MFAVVANFGLTLLASLPSFLVLLRSPVTLVNAILLLILFGLLVSVALIYGYLDYFAIVRVLRRFTAKKSKVSCQPGSSGTNGTDAGGAA